jgi:hypothetical protein
MTSTMLAAPHYHVGSNVAGYLPEGDIAIFADRTGAINYSKSEADRILEDEMDNSDTDDGPLWSLVGDDGDYWLDDSSPYHIPTHFWVQECTNQGVQCDYCGTLNCVDSDEATCEECHSSI